MPVGRGFMRGGGWALGLYQQRLAASAYSLIAMEITSV
jgi:hypothetical protein